MKKRALFILVIGLSGFLFQGCQEKPSLDSYAKVLGEFQNPPAEFRSAPLWVWNDRITRDQVTAQLEDFRAKGIGGVFIHPRPGLITPYLSEEWFELCRYAVEEGKRLGLKVWLYDENSYPSGFAGGHVPDQMPGAAGNGLRMTKAEELEKIPGSCFLILRKTPQGFEDITERARVESFSRGEYYLFDLKQNEPSPWYGGFTYVDLMRKEVTEKFLDVTLNGYKKYIGEEFGRAVPGVFQDEAHILPVGGRDVVNFTPRLFEKFGARWGYDLKLHLPSLFEDVGEWMKVRHNYYATLLELFIENWAKPYYDYCTENSLQFTGHYWEHEWPVPRISPDNMAMYAYSHMPGIDCLMNEWSDGSHAQFGNTRAVKEIRSAANQLGRERLMSETYGAGGWDLTFFDQKRIGDWEYVLGVNFLNQHLSYVTIKGARKRDHPLSFSYHEPWWPAYKMLADYFGRLSVVLSRGKQENRAVILEPTTTAWMYYVPRGETEQLKKLGNDFHVFLNNLEKAQVEYDLASEDILKNHGKARGKKFVVGERAYELVILPPGLENLNRETVSLLRSYLAGGGKVLSWGEPPRFVDGNPVGEVAELASQFSKRWLFSSGEDGLKSINEISRPHVEFEEPASIPGLLFHHRRKLKDAEVVFLVNTSSRDAATGRFSVRGGSVEEWDPFTGKVSPYPFESKDGRFQVRFTIPEGGSLLLCIRPVEAQSSLAEPVYESREVVPQGEPKIRRENPNILTLDYCDLVLGGKAEKDLYFYDAQRRVFQHHGLQRNPWDSAVQFKTNILDQDRFASDSGFEAVYWFDLAKGVDRKSLKLVVEQPELCRVFINGKRVEPLKGEWWLDRVFGVFAAGDYVVEGKNAIALKASPFTIFTELEPVYMLGDFRLQERARGFGLIPQGELALGAWDIQGMPFYSGGVSYQNTYELPFEERGKTRCVVCLGKWSGSVAEVRVGEKTAGFITFKPYELDITDSLVPGRNTVTVVVYGSLKNTLGPHHNNPPLGRAWPGSFQRGAEGGFPPGAGYSVVGYGLFEGFTVESRER